MIEEVILNSPTPPEKSAGFPEGSAFTLIVIAGVVSVFFTSTTLLPPLKNASKGSALLTAFAIEASKRAGSITNFPDC